MAREYRLSIIVSGQDTGAKSMLGGIGSALGSIGTIAGGILGAGFFLGIANQVKEFAKEAISATAQVERMESMLTSLQARELIKSGDFTDMNSALEAAAPLAKATMDQLERIAIISPYQLENVSNTFRMAQAFGYTAAEATVFTKALLDIGAGVGADNGMLDRMAYNLAQVRMVGKVTALDIRQLAMAGLDLNDVLKFVGEQMGVNIETHEDFNKAIENGSITWEDFTTNFGKYADENFGGAAERMSRTMFGLWSSFKDIFALSMPAILGPAFERIGGLLGGLMDNFLNLRDSGALDILGANLAKKIEPGIAAISNFLVSVGLLKTEFANEREWDMPTEKFDLGKLLDGIDYEAIGAKINEFVLWFAAETKSKFDQTDWAGVFTSFSTALGEFTTGLSGQSSSEGFSITKMLGLDSGQVAEIKATLEPIIASVSNFASVFMTEAMPALTVIGAGIVAAWNTMKPALTELWETFVNQLPSGFNTFSEILPVVAAVIVSGLTLVASVITGIVTGVTMAMQGILAAGEFIRSGISSIFEGIQTYASGFFLVLTGLFTNNADLLKQGWRQTWEGFGEIVSGLFQTVIGIISGGLMASLGLVTGFVGGVIGYFENLYNVLVGHSIIPDMMKAIVLSISGGLALAVSNFITWIASVISVVSGGATAVFTAIMSWVPQIETALKIIKMNFYNSFQQAVRQAVSALESMTGVLMTAVSTLITKVLSVIKPIMIKIGVDMPNFAALAAQMEAGMEWLNEIKNGGKGTKGGKSTAPGNGGGSSGGSGSGNGVPQLASGGIASGPRSGFPAILHGTEAVIPLNGGSVPVSLNPSGMGGGGGIFFTFVYSPVVSTASEYEAGSVIGPIVADVVRNEFAKRNM